MNRLIVASSEHCADLWYESGFSAPDPFLWFEIGGQKSIVVSALEAGRAMKQAGDDVRVMSYAEARKAWNIPEGSSMGMAEVISAMAEATGEKQWSVPQDFPFGLACELQKNGLDLSVLEPFSPQREVKTADEIVKIKDAIAMTEIGLRRAFEVLGQSCADNDGILHWNGEILMAEQLGAEINIAIARQGGTAAETITAPGVQGADPHCQGSGPIHEGEPIVMDVFPRSVRTGYFGDLTRTVVKGTASDIVRRTFETVQQAQRLAMELLKPGVPGAVPHKAVEDFFASKGYVTDRNSSPARGFFHGLGHSIGLEIHEGPSLSPRNSRPLVPGNVVTVEPGLYYPEWGGIRIEDDVVITENGCEKLSDLPVFLEI